MKIGYEVFNSLTSIAGGSWIYICSFQGLMEVIQVEGEGMRIPGVFQIVIEDEGSRSPRRLCTADCRPFGRDIRIEWL